MNSPRTAYRVAHFGDSHLGWAAKCRRDPVTGFNVRVVDGYRALHETVTQMIEASVDLAVHAGDFFHRSHPSVADIVMARSELQRLHDAGIPVIGLAGNHDASADRSKMAATTSVHAPRSGVDMVNEPYRRIEPVDGLVFHMISHYGLAQSGRIEPEPVDGAVNILASHGAAIVPGHEIFACIDSPGEQPIGLDLLSDDRFVMKMLGHYHGMGEVFPGVWYSGSSVRRGFSDPAGGRGWLLHEIDTSGSTLTTPMYIHQRPQYDLPAIDAAGLTGADVEERVRANLSDVALHDAVVRQVVTNCNTSTRRGIDQPALAQICADTLMWMPDYRRPTVSDDARSVVDGIGASLRTAGSSDLPGMYDGWVGEWAEHTDLAPELGPIVRAAGAEHLRTVSGMVESSDYTLPTPIPTDTGRTAA